MLRTALRHETAAAIARIAELLAVGADGQDSDIENADAHRRRWFNPPRR